ncbi:MAG: IS110 family transposase [Thermoplasmata archaeon]|nr:MAG: IS110 family transposase [Thermoplasmata archaeon]
MWYIGIDVHKKMCNACIKDRDGDIQKELKFLNKSTGIDKLLEVIDGREAKAVIESTGNMWLRLYLSLEEAGVGVVLANPKKTKAIAEARLKNDKVDARTLADLVRTNLIAPCYVPPEPIRELRNLVRHRINLSRDMTRVKNRIHAILDKYELEFKGTDMFGEVGMKWLKSIVSKLSEVDQLIVDAELRHIGALKQLIEEVEARIAKESMESEGVKLLMGIPGVDYYTALLFTSEIGDYSRFSSANKLISWLGLAPRVHQSGDTSYNGRITKEGSPRVRWALVQAARSAVRWDDHFRTEYQRIQKRRGDGKAIVAIAREIAVAMYHMLNRGEAYRFSSDAFKTKKLKRLERESKKWAKMMKVPVGGMTA